MNEQYGEDLIKAYVCVIKSLVSCCEDTTSHSSTSRFHSIKIPTISIDEYVERIYKYFQCSIECYVCSLAYIDLLLQSRSFILNAYSIHRIVLVTIMEAAKFYDDSFFNNELYSRVGGISVNELNRLEIDFVFLINFSLLITAEEYQRFHNELFKHCHEICINCRCLRFPSLQMNESESVQSCLKYSECSFTDDEDSGSGCVLLL